eukprot:COSAG06_NODE_1302_length_9933_cov_7.954342_15_plen_70_part_00
MISDASVLSICCFISFPELCCLCSRAQVFKKAEKLFGKLQRSVAPFGDWVALGTVDLDEFLEKNLHTVS